MNETFDGKNISSNVVLLYNTESTDFLQETLEDISLKNFRINHILLFNCNVFMVL